MFVASSFSQVSIAVGLAGFACVLLLVLFVLINKYGRRSKFGMKGKTLTLAHGQTHIFIYLFTFTSLHHRVDLFFPLISTELLFYCNRFTSFSCFTESHSSLILLPRVIFFFFLPFSPHVVHTVESCQRARSCNYPYKCIYTDRADQYYRTECMQTRSLHRAYTSYIHCDCHVDAMCREGLELINGHSTDQHAENITGGWICFCFLCVCVDVFTLGPTQVWFIFVFGNV